MKRIITTLCYILFALTTINAQNKITVAQNANTTLSNLTNPTKINVSLLPDGNGNHNVGNTTNAWRNLYLDSNIYIDGTKFIATPANNSIAIGFNALKKIGQGNVNTAVGSYALSANTTGSSNSAFGAEALYSNTTGLYNTAVGTFALFNNTANRNTAVGYAALLNNTIGYSNVALGYAALQNNTSANNLVAIGDSALFHQSATPDDNQGSTAVGARALYGNTTGVDNVAVGRQALYSNTSADWNTAIGSLALYYNTTGGDNTAMGHGALLDNTTGEENTAMGLQALVDNTTGANNTAVGEESLSFNTTGANNTATGWQALRSNTSAEFNTGDGFEAGDNVTDGWYNTFIGSDANCGSAGHLTNSTAIGNDAIVTTNNKVVIGNTSVTSIGGYANWSNFSDGRYKQNIKQNVPGLSFINKLTPVTYTLNINAIENKLHEGEKTATTKSGKTLPGQIDDPIMKQAMSVKSKIIYTGFVAQDVEKAAQSLNYNFSGVDKPADDQRSFYGLRYSDFVVPLVKAVQELSAKNDSLQNENNDLENKYQAQQKEIDDLKAMILDRSTVSGQLSTAISSALLSQNIPNPFSNSTTISYSIQQKFSSAKIIISDKNGSALKTVTLSNNKGSVNINAATLSSGAYQYSLYVDGRLIESKQFIISK
ncbi:MAG TPA: tail fiber domain-containing protein [Parafilimonas sp.]|nr:tail fiber domain-containing protein [Parafilimonas sp.]